MYKELIIQGLTVLIQLAVLFIMGALFNFLNKKIGNEKVQKCYGWVKQAVQAAEQIYKGTGQGEEKKAWVLEYLTKAFGKRLSADDLNILLESAVHEMNLVLKQQGLEPPSAATTPTIQQ